MLWLGDITVAGADAMIVKSTDREIFRAEPPQPTEMREVERRSITSPLSRVSGLGLLARRRATWEHSCIQRCGPAGPTRAVTV